jgi:hypothetical protein
LVHREEGRNGGLLLKIRTLNFPEANRRFFLPHNTPPKWCHPELILRDNHSKTQDKERMSEGSPSPLYGDSESPSFILIF